MRTNIIKKENTERPNLILLQQSNYAVSDYLKHNENKFNKIIDINNFILPRMNTSYLVVQYFRIKNQQICKDIFEGDNEKKISRFKEKYGNEKWKLLESWFTLDVLKNYTNENDIVLFNSSVNMSKEVTECRNKFNCTIDVNEKANNIVVSEVKNFLQNEDLNKF